MTAFSIDLAVSLLNTADSFPIDCFKSLGMMAGTEKGKLIRRYFLEYERALKIYVTAIQQMQLDIAELKGTTSHENCESVRRLQDYQPANLELAASGFKLLDEMLEICRERSLLNPYQLRDRARKKE
jgi:hypothetical protein